MKRLSFLMIAAAGLLFNACSDETVSEGGGGNQGEIPAEGYMALSINLPTTPSTRAVNDDFDDGTPNEYRVHDCALLLFDGATAESATFFSAQNIPLPFIDYDGSDNNLPNTPNPDNITTSYMTVAKVEGQVQQNLWGLVLLNYQNVIDINTATFKDVEYIGDGEAPAVPGELTSTTKFSDIYKYVTKADFTTLTGGDKNRYFFMTNAILADKEGGTNQPNGTNDLKITQLTDLGNKVWDTPELAIANPAGEIFVERAVAKATLNWTNPNWGIQSGDETSTTPENEQLKITVTNIEWTLDNTEPSSFIARNSGATKTNGIPSWIDYASNADIPTYLLAANKYRFVGSASTKSNTLIGSKEDFYRTYWCIDPHYSTDVAANVMNPAEKDQSDNTLFHPTKESATATVTPLYCYENTFDVLRQTHKNTTRAILKVTLEAKIGDNTIADLYTINNDNKLYAEKGVTTRVIEQILSNVTFLKKINERLTDEAKADEGFTINNTNFADYFTLGFTKNDNNGLYEFTSLTFNTEVEDDKFQENSVTFTEEELEDITEHVNSNVKAYKFENNIMYYEARFMHFAGNTVADDMAPWNTWEKKEGSTITAPAAGGANMSYPDNNDNREGDYLGRYGMVRNNWYDVTVTGFLKPGSPVDPSGTFKDPNTPDDDLDQYISIKIHVLSWAKRSQGWELK